ncbi:hypothetical protein HOK51_00305 [Candidatus Woesearchaeota archaeon]|jgi:CYTH domain-containing protein|nr:hypothetical protein [Candidatus Woesearchaeota archaeon]MBT6518254.1 hypothetical protein [Candidatus Woesearchaeota archaeon]MBT7368063.1 hypothetical protein [Candidatus Woesearchaeota archaeon]
MIELEKTFLAKTLPDNLKNCKFKEIIDVYIPKTSEHPKLRLRKNGDKFEFTKKNPVNDDDASHQKEQTIILTETEFNVLNLQLEGKQVRKLRYFYEHNEQIAEFDIFQNELKGLVLIDFEFPNMDEKDNFQMPDFCLFDITQEIFIAGGMICGKSYADMEHKLNRFNYKKLFLD